MRGIVQKNLSKLSTADGREFRQQYTRVKRHHALRTSLGDFDDTSIYVVYVLWPSMMVVVRILPLLSAF